MESRSGESGPDRPAPPAHQLPEAADLLAAIVESSDDAILSKTVEGVIMSWNGGAEQLFGYSAAEVIGKPITIIIPEDRLDEEPRILERIRRGERVEHYETVRRRKDGTLLDISVTISPIRDARGVIVGASKIARDITERRRAEERQQLLLREMSHRVKNVFALAMGLVSLSGRSAETPRALAAAMRSRLAALARAHELTLPDFHARAPVLAEGDADRPTSIVALLRTILAPFDEEGAERITITGADLPVSGSSVTTLALLFHEFATNAAKYGALSTAEGTLVVVLAVTGSEIRVTWTERGGPALGEARGPEGFGSLLERATIEQYLNGSLTREWQSEGLVINLAVPLERLGA